MNAQRSRESALDKRHDPNHVPRRRDALINDVTRELQRRHGGNDVLNRLEAEILVDHYLDRHGKQQADTIDAIIRAAHA